MSGEVFQNIYLALIYHFWFVFVLHRPLGVDILSESNGENHQSKITEFPENMFKHDYANAVFFDE